MRSRSQVAVGVLIALLGPLFVASAAHADPPVITVVGDFQSELGCPADWSPDCPLSNLTGSDGSFTFSTTAIPAGTYQAKVTVGGTWDVNYGADGVQGGSNIPFTVVAGTPTVFSFDSVDHVLTIGDGRPSLLAAKAHWLTPDTIAWSVAANRTYRLVAAPAGGLVVGASGISGGTSVPLTTVPGGLSTSVKQRFPYLATLGALRIPRPWAARAAELLRDQVAVEALDSTGALVDATSVQIPGVLDALYSGAASHARLGVTFAGHRPTLSVWAPTAQQVALELAGSTPSVVPMHRDDRTGVWSVTGPASWSGRYYRYQVKVFAPSTLSVVTNHVTDPYSVALSADSTLSQIVDLDDPALAPQGWDRTPIPAAIPSTRQEIQELHVGDFSAEDATVPAADRGKYLAFTVPGSAGMTHLRDLAKAGVTTVHLLPTFDFAGVPEVSPSTPPCDLASFAPDSDQQQACVAQTKATDDYNWGYNPLHYTVPEGSYATQPTGAARTVQFRQMVDALHAAGLRVVLDVVYNHTAAAGEDPNSVLDQVVPGYYQRLSLSGAVTTDSCCADTAPEHAMMNKLVVDSVTTWAREYKVDGFRFDLMGLDPKQTMLDVQHSLAGLHRDLYLYGEGWDFGVVGGNARFTQATQANMAGTGIGTFNDRLRDAVRGGGPFDTNPHIQGFASGLYTAPNGDPVNGTDPKALLLHSMDLVKLGLTGNLRDYTFVDSAGATVKGSQLSYNGAPAGYTAAPGEAVTYVDAHDNLTLADALTYKLPVSTSLVDRGRLQSLALATTALSQGAGFVQAGSDLLRSKSFDNNSYDSGEWFNAIHWNCHDGTGFGRGLPQAADNQASWPYAQPLLANPALAPTCTTANATTAQYQQFLAIKRSTPLFALTTAQAVQQRLSFPLSGTPAELPGVITEHLDGGGLGTYRSITVVYNATPTAQTQTVPSLRGTVETLHPVQAAGADQVVRQSRFDATAGTFTVPANTVAVFVQRF